MDTSLFIYKNSIGIMSNNMCVCVCGVCGLYVEKG